MHNQTDAFREDNRSTSTSTPTSKRKANELAGKEWLRYSISIWSDIKKTPEEQRLSHPAMFPVSLAIRLLKCFTNDQQTMVLDPFVGSGTTLIAAKTVGKDGIGFDLSREYVELARDRLELQGELFDTQQTDIRVIQDDAANLLNHLRKESVDICITSPPYWDILKQKRSADGKDIRDYDEEARNLGSIDNYRRFIKELTGIFESVSVVLKKGSYCIVDVMDIRKRSKFYPLHSDLALSMEEIGFIYDDFIIWDRRHEYNNFRPLGYPSVFRINRAHEYLMIFRKKA